MASGESHAAPRFGARELFLLGLCALLSWPVIVLNVSDYFAREGSEVGARQALVWHDGHPGARTAIALAATAAATPSGGPPVTDLALLRAAAAAQPAEGRLFAVFALQAEAKAARELAAGAMQAATVLAPQRTDVNLTAFGFWLRQDDMSRALQAANVALTRAPEFAEILHPALLSVMAHPQSDEAFGALLRQRLTWWPAFFRFVADRAPNAVVLRALHALQARGPNRVDEPQLRVYLERLQRDGLWRDAYFTWLDSLPPASVGFTSELHNGGFEEPTRNLGFEWTDQSVQGVLVGFDPTYGTTGTRALHVVFQGLPARWQHFNQYLMLPPGEYHLRGRARVDSLQAERGVQWHLRCLEAAEPLASSERFKGSEPWRHFSVAFAVPSKGCAVQDLRLALTGRAQLDFVASGQVWFDDLSVVRR